MTCLMGILFGVSFCSLIDGGRAWLGTEFMLVLVDVNIPILVPLRGVMWWRFLAFATVVGNTVGVVLVIFDGAM